MACLAKLTPTKLLAASSIAIGLGFGAPALAGSVAIGTPLPPPQKGVNISSGPKAPATYEPIARLQMSSDLLAFGRDTKDPLVLIAAARIMKALSGSEVDLKPEGRAASGFAQKSGLPVSPNSILVEARDFAKGDKIINLLIDQTVAAGTSATIEQPKTHQDTVQARATDVYSVVFNGGQLAEAGVAGDGVGDLDLFVYDENGNLVCRSSASTDREYCRWWPKWTGPFRIEVQNLGGAADLYRLATN